MVKKGSKSTAEEVITLESIENKRLHDLAIGQGVLSKTRRIAATTLPPSNLMVKADGKDITKRSSARRNRYLLVFNCQLAPAAAGRLGTLAKLDTKNPVMYIDFPEGRLRLSGTLVFPKNKYLVLRLGKEALCEDVLESMIVFSEARWIGTEAENPDEEELPMPESLKTTRRHTNVDFGGRGDNKMTTGTNELDYEETQDEGMGDAVLLPSQQQASQPASQRRGSRRAGPTGKRARYAEDSDASFDDADDENNNGDSDAEPAPRKLPRIANSAAARKLPKAKPVSQPEQSKPQSHMLIDLANDTSDDEDQPLVARGGASKQTKRTGLGSMKPTPQAKKSAAAAAKKSPKSQQLSEDEEEIIDLASSSGDEDDAGGSVPASQRPRRAAGAAASQKLRETDDEDDASDDNSGSSDGEEEGSDGAAGSKSEDEYNEEEASDEESDGYAPSE